MNTRLSVWSSYYMDLGPEEAVLEFKKWGYDCTELSDEHGLVLLGRGEPRKVGAQFRAFLEKENFSIPQGHLWLSCKIVSVPDAVDTLMQWLTLYEDIGIENAVLHCDDVYDRPGLPESQLLALNLEKLLEIQERTPGMKIRICLENLMRSFASAEDLLWLLDRLDPGRFGITLDTGHLNISKADTQAGFIRKVGSRLAALHIADNEGTHDQHMMPFGKGNVDFAEVIRALRETGYTGLFNLEIPGERNAPLPVRGYKLEYIRKCYDYMMQHF